MAIAHAPKCQHQQEDGSRCGRPSRRRLRLCDFHHRDLKRSARRIVEQARQPWFESIDLDNPKSVQRALAQITHRLLSREINSKHAGQLLHKLQMATFRTKEKNNFQPVCKAGPKNSLKLFSVPLW
jgi:hypothetical protein